MYLAQDPFNVTLTAANFGTETFLTFDRYGVANSSGHLGQHLMDHPIYLSWALAKDPAQRFASVLDFVAALRVDAPPRGNVHARPGRSIAVLPFVNTNGATASVATLSRSLSRAIVNLKIPRTGQS